MSSGPYQPDFTCEKCGAKGSLCLFPDSLADGCKQCGSIYVLGKLVETTVQSWAADLYHAKKEKK